MEWGEGTGSTVGIRAAIRVFPGIKCNVLLEDSENKINNNKNLYVRAYFVSLLGL